MCCLPSYTKKEWLLIGSLIAVTLSSSLTASLQAPFYPHEAEKKGATATEYGLVFGIFELVSFIACPLLGKNLGKLGAGFVLKCGVIVTGSSTVVFGLLDLVHSHWLFLTLSFIIRAVEAVGVSAIMTASLSIVVVVFEDSFARVFTILEILQGVGFMIGPTVGGYLFEIGGFIAPFGAVGGFVLTAGLFTFFALPDVDNDDMKNKPRPQIMPVLKLVPVMLDAVCLVIQAMSVGFLAATLEPHLRQFELSPTVVGAVFIINGAVYTFVAPVVGILCDKQFNTKKMILLGSAFNIISMMLIGPLPYTPFDTTLWMVALGLFLDGLGMSLMFVPAFVDAIVSAIKYGLPDDINTYAIVSGIYGSAFALGAFIGPSVAGALFDAVGFRQGSLFVIVVHTILFLSILWFMKYEKIYERKYGIVASEDEPRQNGDSKLAPITKSDAGFLDAELKDDSLKISTETELNGCSIEIKEQSNLVNKRYSHSDVKSTDESERSPMKVR